MKKKILVYGATGFIGRNIAERLCKNPDFEVYGTYLNSKPFRNDNINLIKADLRDRLVVDSITRGKDWIIQAASTTSGAKDIVERPYLHVTDNGVMNSLILRSAHDNKVPHLAFFSCTVMYPSSDKPLKEDDFNASQEINPKYFGVGWTKLYVEKMCEFFSRLGNTSYTVMRHSNIYGPYDKFDLDKSHVFGATMTKVLQPRDNKIIVWGDGEEGRDLLYASDLADFVELAVQKQDKPFGIYNVGYGSPIKVKDLVSKIIEHSGTDLKIEYDLSKPTIKTNVFLDTTKAREEFGWERKTSIDDGIKLTLDWYRKNIL